jgi:16S rRNA G966 N2-methylase RsmD
MIYKPDTFTEEERKNIAKSIKPISLETVEKEMSLLLTKQPNDFSPRSRIGNNIVDYFTFSQRLHTKGKYNVNFYEFLTNIEEFKKKKYIQNMLIYYDTVKNKNKQKSEYTVLKEIYNISISAINIIRPLVYMDIYSRYTFTSILDFCAGWGGAAVGAAALKIPHYIGVEINTQLKEPYTRLSEFLHERSPTRIQMLFQNALDVDYSLYKYDMVFTSPPYYFIQKYENNVGYKSKKEMNTFFYIPLFTQSYAGLSPGGIYAINVCKEVFETVLKPLLGEPIETFPYNKSQRQNDYKEMVYVWKKE